MTIRRGTAADRGYVAATWLRSWADAEGHALPDHAVALVDGALAAAECVVAELDTAEGPLLVGWVVYQRGAVHYAYVRQSQRRQGIARTLLARIVPIAAATIMTNRGRRLAVAVLGYVPRLEPWPLLRGDANAHP